MSEIDKAPLFSLVEPWDTEELGVVAQSPVFTLRRRHARSRTRPDKAGEFFYIDSADWVNVIAVTAEEQIVLIEQYRHGRSEITLEVPGGIVDPGESPLEAGVRELREETGYSGSHAEVIGNVTPNPALMNNRCHTVLVRDVVLRHTTQLDGNEEIAVRLRPIEEVRGLIRAGVVNHALVVAAFAHFVLLAEGAPNGV